MTATGPTPTGPAPGPVRYVDLHLVLAEPLSEPLHEDAGAVYDTELAKQVRAILKDNGLAVDEVEVIRPASGVAHGAPPVSWPMHARQLDILLAEVAGARMRAAVAYAEAYLAAEGTQQARAATAELAAAGPRCELETLEGRAEAFRMVLAADARTDALTAAPGVSWDDAPRCVYWWHDPAKRVHRCELYPGHDGAHRDGNSYADRG